MIGTRVGHIRITHVLGQGGMGDVYRGIDERLSRPVALKMIRADHALSAETRARFVHEARTLSSLDHPNICRIYEYIEAPVGDFLVLEYVEGITLDKAIERGLSRARKLRIAIEVADALASAHRNGIVHRDLKPENVMIRKDGSAIVLDFGIARQLEESEIQTSARPAVEPIEQAQTLVYAISDRVVLSEVLPVPVTGHGLTVGTPGAMSPEQALGQRVGPESDMYSFGLLLQQLFTEQAPHPDYLTASELMQRAAIGVSEPVKNQPRDVTTLITHLKSLAKSDRPTAVEALRALHRIVDAPRRRVRLAVVAVLVLVLLAAVAKYVVDITSARREAERRRAQAEELVSFMVGDLRSKLEAVGRLDALDGAATRALAYFASLEPEELSGEDLHKNAFALAQLGEVRSDEGKLDDAAKLFEQSLRFATAAVERDDRREEWRLAQSNARFWLGETLRRKGDPQGALEHFRGYLAIAQDLAARHPIDAKYQAEVSYGHGNVGAAYEAAGDLDHALAEYRLAVDLDRSRLRRDPANGKWQEDLATSLNRVGAVLQTTGDLHGAQTAFAEEMTLRRQLLEASPNDARRIRELTVCLAYTGALQQMLGQRDQALASAAEELELATQLATRDTKSVSARRNRAVAQTRYASLLNDTSRALATVGEAVSELHEVTKIDGRPSWRRDLASALQRQGALRLLAGRQVEARAAAEEALAILEPIAAEDPRNTSTRRVLCEALLTAADADTIRAESYRRKVVDLTASLPPRADPRLIALRERALAALHRS